MATKERAKARTRIVIAAVIVAAVFVGVSIPMILLIRGGEESPEIPWIKVTGVIDRTVTFQNGDVTLAGTLDHPAGEGPFPAIVTVHGSAPVTRNDRYNLLYSDFFLQHGFAVLRYDKRGVGESTGEYPDVGEYADDGDALLFEEDSGAKLTSLADDAIAGVGFLKNHERIDPNRIGVMGISQAGWIVALAAERSEDVAFFVALSGTTATIGQEMHYSELAGDYGHTAEMSEQEASDMAKNYDGIQGYDPLPTLEKITVPGLWILGGKDKSIPVPLTMETLDSLKEQGKDFTYIYYPNANHGLVDEDTRAFYPFLLDTLNWLEAEF